MVVGSKSIQEETIIQPKEISERISALTGIARESLLKKLLYPKCKSYFSSNYGPILTQKKWLKRVFADGYDIHHLHWVGNGFIPIRSFERFNTPIVWTMHDMWAFTGGCHVIGACTKYEKHCGRCPQIFSTKENDVSRYIHHRKRKIFSDLNMTIIAPSHWVKDNLKRSSLLGAKRIEVIPNPIDLETYKPLDKKFSRDTLKIYTDKKVIAFGSISPTSDENKGFAYLSKAMEIIVKNRHDICILLFGSSDPRSAFKIDCDVKYVGKLSDDITLSLLYSAADVVVVPSKQESFSQVAMESISCGTPVVAFAASGLLDIIDHKINGYLAVPYETQDLAVGIEWILEDGERWKMLSSNAREKAKAFNGYERIAQRHIDLYREILYGCK
jgi:glycosyltransferase involved in cell wall biosynthesis